MLRLLDESPNVVQYARDDVHVMVWRGALDSPGLERTRVAGLELARQHANGIWALNVIQAGIAIPDLAVQRKAAEVTSALDSSLRDVAIVLPGEGFWVSAARSFLGGVTLIARSKTKRHVVGDVGTAMTWLAARSGRSAQWAAAVTAELDRVMATIVTAPAGAARSR